MKMTVLNVNLLNGTFQSFLIHCFGFTAKKLINKNFGFSVFFHFVCPNEHRLRQQKAAAAFIKTQL